MDHRLEPPGRNSPEAMRKNNWIESLVFRLGDRALQRDFYSNYRQLEKEHSLSDREKAALLETRWEYLCDFARKNIPFYKDYFSSRIDETINLSEFPVLLKEDLREKQEAYRVATTPEKQLYYSKTGGSTAEPLTIPMYRSERDRWLAYQLLFWKKGGYRAGDPTIQIGVTPRTFSAKCKDLFLNVTYVHTNQLSDAHIGNLLNGIRRGKYLHLIGYPSRIKAFYRMAERYFGNESLTLKSIICIGDKIMDEDREQWMKRFGATVVETYGATEGVVLGCALNSPLIDCDASDFIVEILDEDNRPVSDGKVGYITVTNLIARYLPLIRYRIGDLGAWVKKGDKKYLRIIGRVDERLQLQSGAYLTVRDVFRYLSTEWKIDHYTLTNGESGYILGYIRDEAIQPPEIPKLMTGIRDQLGLPIEKLERMDKVKRYPSGKPLYFDLSHKQVRQG